MDCSTLGLAETSPQLVPNASNTVTPTALVKTIIVWGLGLILAWRPSLAILLGRLVLRLWPNFRRS